MESAIVRQLRPEFEPVAVVWIDTLPDGTVQFRPGRFGCVLYLFAEAARRGRITGGSRESITCSGGRAALGLGSELDASEARLDRNAALYSKGLASARDQAAYRAVIEGAPERWRAMYEYGERRHCNAELAREWILHGLPRYDIPHEYVLFKPLSHTAPDENVRAIIFPVSPVELAGLVTLAGSVLPGTDAVQVPQGADCTGIAAFAYAQGERAEPKAVLGMLGVDGREMMRKRFRDDVLTLTLPAPLFWRMEEEAEDSILQIPSWRALRGDSSPESHG
jgi:hypothetical protein